MKIDRAVLIICNLAGCKKAPKYFKEAAESIRTYYVADVKKPSHNKRKPTLKRSAVR